MATKKFLDQEKHELEQNSMLKVKHGSLHLPRNEVPGCIFDGIFKDSNKVDSAKFHTPQSEYLRVNQPFIEKESIHYKEVSKKRKLFKTNDSFDREMNNKKMKIINKSVFKNKINLFTRQQFIMQKNIKNYTERTNNCLEILEKQQIAVKIKFSIYNALIKCIQLLDDRYKMFYSNTLKYFKTAHSKLSQNNKEKTEEKMDEEAFFISFINNLKDFPKTARSLFVNQNLETEILNDSITPIHLDENCDVYAKFYMQFKHMFCPDHNNNDCCCVVQFDESLFNQNINFEIDNNERGQLNRLYFEHCSPITKGLLASICNEEYEHNVQQILSNHMYNEVAMENAMYILLNTKNLDTIDFNSTIHNRCTDYNDFHQINDTWLNYDLPHEAKLQGSTLSSNISRPTCCASCWCTDPAIEDQQVERKTFNQRSDALSKAPWDTDMFLEMLNMFVELKKTQKNNESFKETEKNYNENQETEKIYNENQEKQSKVYKCAQEELIKAALDC